VPAQRQPFVQLAMMDDQNLFVVNNENGNGEINFIPQTLAFALQSAPAGEVFCNWMVTGRCDEASNGHAADHETLAENPL
jgi:hypothetical protein